MIAETVRGIIAGVQSGGEAALREYAVKFGDLASAGDKLLLTRSDLKAAFAGLKPAERELLERVGARIRRFAEAQLECFKPLNVEIEGGRAGYSLLPVERVGCYAPGGRYPLPSSVLMTVIPARTAGVRSIVVAAPKPTPVMLAAAFVAGADEFLCVGGAQAVAALAYGAGAVQPCAMIVGPGNAYVTEAKRQVFGTVGIDMLAGPSELLIIADDSADPKVIAADLLAQAEHDTDARPMLLATTETLVCAVQKELAAQLETLPSAPTAGEALKNGFLKAVPDLQSASLESNRVAPEHLQLMVRDPQALLPLLTNYGAVFLGSQTAEVFGDYGAGPNHVLPTAGSARFSSPLSVFTFLRTSTWLDVRESAQLREDSAALSRLEGLEGHARAAEIRM